MKPCVKLHAQLRLLADVRERALDRAQTELGKANALCARHERNIERLEELARSASAGASLSPSLALNEAAYRQAVLGLAQSQRADLQVRRAEAGLAHKALRDAAREQQVIDSACDRVGQGVRVAAGRRAQQRLDEVAAQMWLRGRRDI